MDKTVYNAFLVTILRTIIGLFPACFFTSLVAYGMSRKNLKGRNLYMSYMLVTMFWGRAYTILCGIKKQLIDNFLVYIIPLLTYGTCWCIAYFRKYLSNSESPDRRS